jgi:hypothetical protein
MFSRLFEPRRSFASVVRELVDGLETGRVILGAEGDNSESDAPAGPGRSLKESAESGELSDEDRIAHVSAMLAQIEQILAKAEEVRSEVEAIRDEMGKRVAMWKDAKQIDRQ